MKVRFAVLAAVACVALSTSAQAAAVLLGPGNYSENFDSMGTGATTPAGWGYVAVTGSSSDTSTEAAINAAFATPALLAGTAGTTAALTTDGAQTALNVQISGTDRALGSRPTSLKALLLQLDMTNNTGAALNSVNFSYSMVNFIANQNNTVSDELIGYRFAYTLDGGTSFTRVAGLDTIPTLNDLTTIITVSQTITFGTPVAIGGSMSFRFYDDNAIGASWDTGHAITNATVAVPEPATLSLLGLAALPLIRRRRA